MHADGQTEDSLLFHYLSGNSVKEPISLFTMLRKMYKTEGRIGLSSCNIPPFLSTAFKWKVDLSTNLSPTSPPMNARQLSSIPTS